jgi:hypothetical protein
MMFHSSPSTFCPDSLAGWDNIPKRKLVFTFLRPIIALMYNRATALFSVRAAIRLPFSLIAGTQSI